VDQLEKEQLVQRQMQASDRRSFTVSLTDAGRKAFAAMALAQACPDLDISSAGLHALVGHAMDPESRDAAALIGVTVTDHSARQFDASLGSAADVILVMEKHHRNEIASRFPQLTAKTFLLGHFENAKEIPDPYKMGPAHHHRAAELIAESARLWAAQFETLR
jgi:protein-tyrosine phosphatase